MKLLILAQIVISGGLQPNPTFQTGNGSIEGTAVNEVTQAPVRRAEVTLGAPNVPTAVTDSTGHFAFKNLAPGVYWIGASHPEYPRPQRAVPSRPLSVTLGPDEHKVDLVIPLTPGATISGTITDEDKKPLSGCGVQALSFQPGQPDRRLSGGNMASTDGRGLYRLYGLPKGRYYLMAQCNSWLPAPHPLMRTGPDADVPHLRYSVEFYPSPPDSTGSGRLTVAAGADLQNVDFQMQPTATVTVRGRFGGDMEALLHNPWVDLAPRDPLLKNFMQQRGFVNTRRNTFRINAVPPGQYVLTAVAQDETHSYESQMPIDIGAVAPDPIEITFFAGSNFTGSIEMAAGGHEQQQQPIENAQVQLIPVEQMVYGGWPHAQIAKDGTFTLSKVMPGRWRLQVNGLMGYVKSFTIGDQAVSPYNFNVSPGAGGTMRIVMGDKTAQIEGSVTGIQPDSTGNIQVMLVPEDPDRLVVGRTWNTSAAPGNGRFGMNGIEPGKYRLYAFDTVEPWTIQQNFALLKAIADKGVELDLEEGAQTTAQVEITPIEEITKLIQEVE